MMPGRSLKLPNGDTFWLCFEEEFLCLYFVFRSLERDGFLVLPFVIWRWARC
jgi:hypothetical protein